MPVSSSFENRPSFSFKVMTAFAFQDKLRHQHAINQLEFWDQCFGLSLLPTICLWRHTCNGWIRNRSIENVPKQISKYLGFGDVVTVFAFHLLLLAIPRKVTYHLIPSPNVANQILFNCITFSFAKLSRPRSSERTFLSSNQATTRSSYP